MGSPLFPNWNKRNQQGPQPPAGQQKKPGFTGWIKAKIQAEVQRRLGPLGSLMQALLRPGGKQLAADIEKEVEGAKAIIDQFRGVTSEFVPGGKIPPSRPFYRVGDNPPPDDDDVGQFPPDQPILEGMIDVDSSNVHSIGYIWPQSHSGNGDLLVRFLGGSGKNRQGPGALYRYRNVPKDVWAAFKIASSAGMFVWDELRVRGTIAGHQYSYDLEELGNLSDIPRQAGLKPGMAGEWWMQRDYRGRRSNRPERQVRGPRGTLPGWRGELPDRRRTGRR